MYIAAVTINRIGGFCTFFNSFCAIFLKVYMIQKKPLPENEAFVKFYLFWKFQENPISYVGVIALSLSIF